MLAPKKQKTKRVKKQSFVRTSKQLVRLVLTIEKLRTAGCLSLADLYGVDPETSSRTYRRDFEILTRLDWCEPVEDERGVTVWRWTKDN